LLPLLWGAGPMALMLWLDGMMMMMMIDSSAAEQTKSVCCGFSSSELLG
jgi:hypothetical protein